MHRERRGEVFNPLLSQNSDPPKILRHDPGGLAVFLTGSGDVYGTSRRLHETGKRRNMGRPWVTRAIGLASREPGIHFFTGNI